MKTREEIYLSYASVRSAQLPCYAQNQCERASIKLFTPMRNLRKVFSLYYIYMCGHTYMHIHTCIYSFVCNSCYACYAPYNISINSNNNNIDKVLIIEY